MGVDASWPLKAAVLGKLRENTRIRTLLGDSGQVADLGESVQDHISPVVAVARLTSHAWHSATFDGQDHELVLDIRMPRNGPLRDICMAVTESLHGADFPVGGHALIEMSFESSQTREDANTGLDCCKMYFRALTVSD